MAFINYINTVIDFIYPRHCFSCGNTIRDESEIYLCNECRNKIKIADENRCKRCGSAIGPFTVSKSFGCISCKNIKLWFDAVYCITDYEGVIRELICRFKYYRKEVINIPLSNIMIEGSKRCSFIRDVDLILPVPLFWQKRIKREFNQSALIARKLAGHYSIPVSVGNLRRIRNTGTQTKLTRMQRIENVKNAFDVKKPTRLVGKTILLVDDVMTTGVTASECARMLKGSGVKKVYVIILARAGVE